MIDQCIYYTYQLALVLIVNLTIRIEPHKKVLYPFKMSYQIEVQGQTTSAFSENIDRCSTAAPSQHFRNHRHLLDRSRINSSAEVALKIQKVCINCGQGIHPRRFCRRWYGLEAISEDGRPRFTEGLILAMELEHGYREKCINLLARILQIKPNTIQRWGKGVDFDKIPADILQKYEIYLGYVDAIRVITTSLKQFDEDSLLKLLRRLEVR